MSDCPCQSGNAYSECCEPFITGQRQAETAEQLMRARYTAHVKADMDFVLATHHPETRGEFNQAAAQRWAEDSEWLGLSIVGIQNGTPQDDSGQIEFIASYRDRAGQRHKHHELSLFERLDGTWFFRDGEPAKVKQVRRENEKVGRNDPCPCGSSKKFKKCCGLN